MEKLQIYYQPKQDSSHAFKSLTISYYDFDEAQNTFNQKIVLEKGREKYKIKAHLDLLESTKSFLENLDLSDYKPSDVNPGDAYFFIKYGDQSLMTSNADDIRKILDWCHFDEILAYDLSEYKKCD